jgi:MOSC domain-containing protein YiiM
VLSVPCEAGSVELVVARNDDGSRETPSRVTVMPGRGIPGDRWARGGSTRPDAEVTLMRADVARLVGNGQPLTVPGDNLLVHLDLSSANLPAGSLLRIGTALLEVTPLPHTGCAKFKARFGQEALRLTADPRFRQLRLRGIHARIIEPGEISPGDAIQVRKRPGHDSPNTATP